MKSDRTISILHYVSYALPVQAGNTLRTHRIAVEQKRMGFNVAVCEGMQPKSRSHAKPGHPAVVHRDGIPYFYYNSSNLRTDPLRAAVRRLAAKRVPGASRLHRAIDVIPYFEWIVHTWGTPDIVHAHSSPEAGRIGRRLARHAGAKFVYEVRGFWKLSRAADAGRPVDVGHALAADVRMSLRAERVFVIGREIGRQLMLGGVSSDAITYTPNGVDTREFQPLPRDTELAKRLEIEGKTVFGYITNVRRLEGIQTVIDAWPQVLEKIPNAVFILVGDGDYLCELKHLVENRKLAQSWRFPGRVQHGKIGSYYSVIDAFVVPRLPEPVCRIVPPLKPLEAMAMGVPVIVSNVPALLEIVSPDETGLTFEAGAPDSLAQTLVRMNADVALRNELAGRARTWVCEHRDWAVVSRPYTEVYTALCV
jgi:glycosyltransferase involved in cell wall biosynthesis